MSQETEQSARVILDTTVRLINDGLQDEEIWDYLRTFIDDVTYPKMVAATRLLLMETGSYINELEDSIDGG